MEPLYLTIPRLARLVGVTPPTVRQWVRRGWIQVPQRIGPSGTLAYSQPDVAAIERWYLRHSANGLCRGIGADEKRRRALAVLAQSD
jgi:DNA-binding transcriptional MerR regulator